MACEILKIALPIHYLIHCGLQESDGKEGGYRQAAEPQWKCFHSVALPDLGAHARFDIVRKALHNALHLGNIGGHDVKHHVADPTISVAADVVLDRCRAARQGLARSPAVIGKDKRSAEGNGNVLRIAACFASLIAQAGDSFAHLGGREAGRRTQADGMPAISQTRCTTNGRRRVPTDPDRWVWLAGWFGREANVRKAHVLASKIWLLARPQGPKNFNILVADLTTLVERVETERVKFLFHPAHANPQDNAATGERIERGDHFGGEEGVAIRQDEYAGTELHPRGARRQERQGGQGFIVVLIRR